MEIEESSDFMDMPERGFSKSNWVVSDPSLCVHFSRLACKLSSDAIVSDIRFFFDGEGDSIFMMENVSAGTGM